MTTEAEIKQQENERDGVMRLISAMETALTASPDQHRGSIQLSLQSLRGRLVAVEKKIVDSRAEQSQQTEEKVVLAEQLAEQETKLNATEQKNLAGFLAEDYFTKSDFGRLEDFYEKSWDRLSERGKDAMSHRVWEGVRHGKYKFSDLPPIVQEKEMERVHRRLQESAIGAGFAAGIPERDRKDFIRAYEAGRKEEAAEVLDRDSFKKVMFRQDESKGVNSVQAALGPQETAVGERIAAGAPPRATNSKPRDQDLNLDGVQLGGLKLADSKSEPTVNDMPQKEAATGRSNALLRGG